ASAPALAGFASARSVAEDRSIGFTAEDIRRFAPRALKDYVDALIEGGQPELASFGISDNPMRLCHFMAQIGHECGGLTVKRESLNYTTTARLRAVWPSRFPDDASARPYVRNEEKLAEKVYGGRLGHVQTGGGFCHRGPGFLQITGGGGHRGMGGKLQLPLAAKPQVAPPP